MNKREFIDELCRRLRLMPADEAQRIVMFYAETIDDRMEDGMTEEEAVASLGDLDDIVREVTGGRSWDGGQQSDGDPGARASGKRKLNRYTLSAQGVTELKILESSCDTILDLSPDGDIHIACAEGDGVWYELTSGNVVTVRKVIENSFKLFGISLKLPFGDQRTEDKLTILVPETLLRELTVSVTTASGDLDVRVLRLRALAAKSAGGDITLGGLSCEGDVSLATVSGDISSKWLSGRKLSVHTVSGDVSVEEFNGESLKAATTSGLLDLPRVSAAEAKLSSVSGKIAVYGSVNQAFAASSVSGDMDFTLYCATHSVSLESVSGDIEGALAADEKLYSLSLKTNSGRLSAPQGVPGAPNHIRGKTVSGNITLRFR